MLSVVLHYVFRTTFLFNAMYASINTPVYFCFLVSIPEEGSWAETFFPEDIIIVSIKLIKKQ